MFEGKWKVCSCSGTEEVTDLLTDAWWYIEQDGVSSRYSVSFKQAGSGLLTPFEASFANQRLQGQDRSGRYYFELVAIRPPEGLKAKRCLYGIFGPITGGSNGDLGDPGTWKAEESGPEGEQEG